MRLARIMLLAVLASSRSVSDACAWPAALQTGTPVRLTVPTSADSVLSGSFVRHDDSTLTFTPVHTHDRMRLRFGAIERLEADVSPLHATGHATRVWAALGGVAGWGLTTWMIGASAGDMGTGAVVGLVGAIPGALLGGLAGGLLGGTAATLTHEPSWREIPRRAWTTGAFAPADAVPDSAAH